MTKLLVCLKITNGTAVSGRMTLNVMAGTVIISIFSEKRHWPRHSTREFNRLWTGKNNNSYKVNGSDSKCFVFPCWR